ncbi:MAG: uroporphyrinogen-III synthase [Methanomicrobiaceae archaeon]|nr:uroporphyrinogen-III synthase [Methanomicrobiaceae archaeon]
MRIAITRLADKGGRDPARCKRLGHDCYPVSPLAATVYPERVAAFVAAVHRGAYDCLFFTSALPAQIIGPLLERWPRVVAIGPQTAQTLQEMGIASETLPSYYSRDFAPYLGEWLRGKTVGIPRADVPNPALLDAIRERGGEPVETRVYGLEATGEELDLGRAEALLFTSAGSFRQAVWTPRPGLLLMAIGEITAEAMAEGGAIPAVVGDGSLEGTLRRLNAYLEEQGSR